MKDALLMRLRAHVPDLRPSANEDQVAEAVLAKLDAQNRAEPPTVLVRPTDVQAGGGKYTEPAAPDPQVTPEQSAALAELDAAAAVSRLDDRQRGRSPRG